MTPRDHAEGALRNREAWYRRIVETAGEGIWMVDQTGRVSYANERMATMLGSTVAEMVQRPLADFIAAEGRPVLCECLDRASRGEVVREELQLRRQDGATLWAVVATTCLVGPQSRVVGVLCMVTDVTERKRAEDAARALAEVAREIAGPLALPDVAERIVNVVLRALRAHRAALFEVDAASGDLTCLAAAGRVDRAQMVGRVVGTGVGVVGRALAAGRPVWFPEVSTLDPRLDYPEWARRVLGEGSHSSMAVPLTVKGETIGALGFAAEPGRPATAEDLDLLSALAHQAAVALQNARFVRDQELRARRLGVLSRLNQLITTSLDANGVLGALTRAAAEIADAPYAAIWLVDQTGKFLERHSTSVETYPLQRQPVGVGLMGWTAQHRSILNVPDATVDPRTARPDWFETTGLRSAVAIPIIHESALLGVLTLSGTRPFRLEGGSARCSTASSPRARSPSATPGSTTRPSDAGARPRPSPSWPGRSGPPSTSTPCCSRRSRSHAISWGATAPGSCCSNTTPA